MNLNMNKRTIFCLYLGSNFPQSYYLYSKIKNKIIKRNQ